MRIATAYHPQSNGLDERTNQTLKRSVFVFCVCMYNIYVCCTHFQAEGDTMVGKSLGLTVTDKKILDYHHKWLNDRLINLAQKQKQRADRITSVHRADSVWKLRLWVICSSICYLIVWGHWSNYLHLSPAQHATPLSGVHQQRRNEAIPDRENPSAYH